MTDKIEDTLNYQGNTYVNAGEAPCPREGWEDGLVMTQTPDGVPAYWSDGCLYVLKYHYEAADQSSWANKTPPPAIAGQGKIIE